MFNLTEEQIEKSKEVFAEVKRMEKEYNSNDNRKLTDIQGCYVDSYILEVWESERDEWSTFEDFLISLIQQNIELG